jgi:ADP-dependent NAD(P)H-hydrate dehydratase
MADDPLDLPRVPPRAAESHKGDYGRLLVVGGSRGMSGAVALTGMAALRAGAGLVTLAVPDACLDTVAAFDPCLMTVPLPCDSVGALAAAAADLIQSLAQRMDVLACGPGLGQGPQVARVVRALYSSIARPMVVDADGLNALAADAHGLAGTGGPRVITPHPGEFQRLCGVDLRDAAGQATRAQQVAREAGLVVVLKGHHTLVTDGRRSARNTTGNPGMATAGSGDVLTGIIAALVAQGLAAWEAARLGVHLHGLAGDIAARELTQAAMTARDLVQHLPQAWKELGY